MGEGIHFRTERLAARPMGPGDEAAMLSVYGDADAMRYVGDGSPISEDEIEAWLGVTARNFAQRGYGMWALVEEATGEIVGFLGLVHPDGQPEVELKYALRRDRWGQGLATEAARGAVVHGHRTLGITSMIATCDPPNTPSHRVLEKCGFRRGPSRFDEEGEIFVYVWNAPDQAWGPGGWAWPV